jgi:hypothetical protein
MKIRIIGAAGREVTGLIYSALTKHARIRVSVVAFLGGALDLSLTQGLSQ